MTEQLHPEAHRVRLRLQEAYPGTYDGLGLGILSALLYALDGGEIEQPTDEATVRVFRMERGDGAGPWWSLAGERRTPHGLEDAPLSKLPMDRLEGFETGDGRVWASAAADLGYLADRLVVRDYPRLSREGFGVTVYEVPASGVREIDGHVVFDRNLAEIVDRRSPYFARRA